MAIPFLFIVCVGDGTLIVQAVYYTTDASDHMVLHLNTPGKTLVDAEVWAYVNEMCLSTVKSARSFACVSPLTVLQTTLVIRTSSNSFHILSCGFPVPLLTLEAAKLAMCLFSAMSQNVEEQMSVLFHGSVSMLYALAGLVFLRRPERKAGIESEGLCTNTTEKAEMNSHCRRQNESQLGSGTNCPVCLRIRLIFSKD